MKKLSPKESVPFLQHTGKEPHLLKEIMLTHLCLLNSFPRISQMPVARFALFRIIAVSDPEPLGTMELARRLGVNAAAITRQLKDMEAENLIRRSGDPKDARRSHVLLTDKGRALFGQLHDRIHKFEASLRSSLSDADMATAVNVLATLRQTLTTFSEGRQ